MIAASEHYLHQALASYLQSRWLAPSTAGLYSIAVQLYEEWHGGPVLVSAITPLSVLDWMRWLAQDRCPQTVNSKRRSLLTIIRSTGSCPVVPRMKEVRRVPVAWSMDDLQRLLAACERARLWHVRHRRSWTAGHWRALILCTYDTSIRIGALLTVPRSAVDLNRRTLLIPGEHHKQRSDTLHRLHQQTCDAIAKLPPSRLLFEWPMRREQIWVWLGRIQERAGLPTDRRSKFHRLRRTSYSHVKHKLGTEAAMRHAGHAVDLSALYYDPTIFDDAPNPLSVLPRP